MLFVQLKASSEIFAFAILLKIATSYQGVLEDGVTWTEIFQDFRTSTSQRCLDTITKANGKWGDDLSRYQPDNEVWTQLFRWVKLLRNQPVDEAWTQTQQRERSGGLRKRRSGGRLFLSVSCTLARSFRSVFGSNWRKITFFLQNKIDILQFNLRALV